MIGQFPWDPFPPGEPEPKGPDPVQNLAFRSAVTAADAYRSVRLALRRDRGALRVGNRFVSNGRYREFALLSLGNAANSMALAALHTLGDRLTQGFLAGPEPVPSEIPFHGAVVPPGWGGAPAAAEIVGAAEEIAAGLGEQDLLVVLLSSGALRALLLPPPGVSPEEFAGTLASASAAGATGREVGLLARVLGTGAVGGRLAAATRSDVATFLVDRGDGPTVVGGGPMRPVGPAERVEARAILERTGTSAAFPSSVLASLGPDTTPPTAAPRGVAPPVIVAGPADALRAAADAVFEKGWTSRLAFLVLSEPPEAGADRLLARTEELLAAEPLTTDSRTKGLVAFAMTTLGLPEGVDEGPALGRFLERANEGLRRREMSVGLFRTAGDLGSPAFPAGAVVGAPTERSATRTGHARAVRMRRGITDVGALAIALVPPPSGNSGRGPTP